MRERGGGRINIYCFIYLPQFRCSQWFFLTQYRARLEKAKELATRDQYANFSVIVLTIM